MLICYKIFLLAKYLFYNKVHSLLYKIQKYTKCLVCFKIPILLHSRREIEICILLVYASIEHEHCRRQRRLLSIETRLQTSNQSLLASRTLARREPHKPSEET